MTTSSAILARTITSGSSTLSYLITRILVDKDLADDCYRAYAYFRWADDMIDVELGSCEESVSFIRKQKQIVNLLYQGERCPDLSPEETMVADLIRHDRRPNSGLQSFIRNFLDVLEFDAARRGQLITNEELQWYSECLGRAVTDAIQYFIGNERTYPASEKQYLAATAAHFSHMLRDLRDDVGEGFLNLPVEWLASNGYDHENYGSFSLNPEDPIFKEWVRDRVELARSHFRAGKEYLEDLEHLRCKIAGYWYCARFECVLSAVERDNYVLRPIYEERRRKTFILKMGWITIGIAYRHFMKKLRSRLRRNHKSGEHFWFPEDAVPGYEERAVYGKSSFSG